MSEPAPPRMSDLEIDAIRDGDTYHFFLPDIQTYSNMKQYRINGVPIARGGNNFSTKGEPTIEVYACHERKVGARSLVEGLPDLSMVEYLDKKDALSPTEPPAYEGEGRTFKDLDAEYAYKRFMQSYKVETETVWEVSQRVRLSTREKIEPPNQFIIPGRHIGDGIASQSAHYMRQGHLKHLMISILTENGYVDEEDKMRSAPKALRFKAYDYRSDEVKLYVGGTLVCEFKGRMSFTDTMEAVIARMEEDRRQVERELGFFLAGTRRNLNAFQVANILQGAYDRAMRIDSKVATADEKRALLTFLRDQIERLKSLDLNGEDENLAPALAQ